MVTLLDSTTLIKKAQLTNLPLKKKKGKEGVGFPILSLSSPDPNKLITLLH